MKHHSFSNWRLCLAFLCGLAAIFIHPVFVRAGDIERYCPMGPGTGVVKEHWITTTVKWSVSEDPQGNVVPGFPDVSCGITPTPGIATLVLAAQKWNAVGANVQLATIPGKTPYAPTSVSVLNPNPGPTYVTISSMMFDITGNDTVNLVTFQESSAYFLLFGGAAVLANTPVDTFPGSGPPGTILDPVGQIDEADIAFNTLGGVSFRDNDALGLYPWISNPSAMTAPTTPGTPPSTFVPPSGGIADLYGTAVHEFGHFLGLGHSIIESQLDGTVNLFPTMVGTAQTEFPPSMELAALDCSVSTLPYKWKVNVSGSAQFPLLGRGARTLEPDDTSALWDGYPAPTGWLYPGLGSIRGDVQIQDAYNILGFTTPMVGASITAVSVTNPNSLRVAALTTDNGSFEVPALPPGDYYLFAQRTEVFMPSGYRLGYFDPAGPLIPNFVWPGLGGCVSAASFGSPPLAGTPFSGRPLSRLEFIPEYFTRPDLPVESTYQSAYPLHVVAGAALTGLTIQVADHGPCCTQGWPAMGAPAPSVAAGRCNASLTIKRANTPPGIHAPDPWSDRGIWGTSAGIGDVQFRVSAQCNDLVDLLIGDSRTFSMLNGQLVEIAPRPIDPAPTNPPLTPCPCSVFGPCSAYSFQCMGASSTCWTSGSVPGWFRLQGPGPWSMNTLDPTALGSRIGRNTLVQAIVWPDLGGGVYGPPFVSNVVNFWITN